MSKSLKYLLLIVITAFLAAGVYIYKPISGGVAAFTQQKPCSEPMSFSLGTVDTQFAIDPGEVKSAATEAASLWNSTGKSFLEPAGPGDEDADIIIRFVYDERQERTDAELRFRERIRSGQAQIDRMQAQHEQQRELFDARSAEYLNLTGRTTDELSSLNEWVRDKNEAGGFTEEEYEQFTQRKSDVERLQERGMNERAWLDEKADRINREMDDINDKVNENNRLIEQYNSEYAGDLRFTKATFQKIGRGGVITVSQFMNKRELRLILAHELGHALGIGHLSNPESVMHNRMGEQEYYPAVMLTDEDISAVQNLCN
ncbi:hypothetical protein DYD21_02845 [Rhodohalobacter sp. SW132]|uniref:matrixin family metalloprotease n=1 Tax=Rhodohalobacter sp. SW132 TaxID=2293433 RepID=UPI000E23E32B|nr:matrixin family metalloprotease [Rhodohalobacter sp. SW132]REL38907.1 hypothetical protein DYD21_02845 [Rhodohalobacter sp. SW132]